NARKPIFGYRAMIGSLIGISLLSFVVWAHHMFVTGMNPFLGSVFMFLTLIIAVPSGVKVFNWLATLWRGNIRFTTAMLLYLVFMPMHYVGIAGFPRRYYSWTGFDAFSQFADLNKFISAAAILAFFAQFIFIFNFFYSIFRGRRATENPWNSTTLEWTTPI